MPSQLSASAGLETSGQRVSSDRPIKLLPGECWWGGRVTDSAAMPFNARSCHYRSLTSDDRAGGNQAQPLLVSSCGRFVWGEEPFTFEVRNGEISFSGTCPTLFQSESKSLRGAFNQASQRFFPTSRKMPASGMFTRPQYCTWIELVYNQSEEEILKYARSLIEHGYPPGLLIIDDNWQEDYGVWDFSSRRFSSPKAMIAELHELGFHVMLWVSPFISPDSATYRDLLTRKFLLRDTFETQECVWSDTKNDAAMIRWWNGVSAVLDLSNPEAVTWFTQQLHRLQNDFGVDGFKFDAGDSSFYIPEQGGKYRSFVPRTAEQHTMDFAAIGLNFPFNEYRACWRQAGQPLAQRLRDKDHSWAALQELIPGVITQGLLGYAFTCPDLIGGGLASAFSDPKKFDPELVVRSAQVHALMPMMQFSVAPWRVLTSEMGGYCLSAAKLHAEFGAKILENVADAARTGEPVIRPLAWRWPGLKYETIADQFLLGNDVLVAPVVVRGARERSITFPPGDWIGDDGERVRGPTEKTVAVPLSRLPYYRRLGD